MNHPYKERGKVELDPVVPPFTPERALEIVKEFKPQRAIRQHAAKKEQKELAQKEKDDAKNEARLWAEGCWDGFSNHIMSAAKDGYTSVSMQVPNKQFYSKSLIAYARGLGWKIKHDRLESSPYNKKVVIYWGRLAWLRMRLMWVIIAVVTIIVMYMASPPWW